MAAGRLELKVLIEGLGIILAIHVFGIISVINCERRDNGTFF